MPCQKCLVKPGYHSFKKIGVFNSVSLFYTAPAKTEDYNQEGTKLANIKIHVLEETHGPWLWILDCSNMALKHYTEISFNIGILQMLSEDKHLKSVWILYPNFWFRSTVAFLQTLYSSPVLTNIVYLEGSRLELYTNLEKQGLPNQEINRLLQELA